MAYNPRAIARGHEVPLERISPDTHTRHEVPGMAAVYVDTANFTGSGEAEQLGAAVVTGDFFQVVGAEAQIGRLLAPADDKPGAPRAVVLSHRFWQSRFEGKPDILGQAMVLDGDPYTVVGVLPDSFWFRSRGIEVWAPFQWPEASWHTRGNHFLEVVGRLKPGVDPKVASDQRGHGIGVSLDVYTSSDLEQKREALKKLEAAVIQKAATEAIGASLVR